MQLTYKKVELELGHHIKLAFILCSLIFTIGFISDSELLQSYMISQVKTQSLGINLMNQSPHKKELTPSQFSVDRSLL